MEQIGLQLVIVQFFFDQGQIGDCVFGFGNVVSGFIVDVNVCVFVIVVDCVDYGQVDRQGGVYWFFVC